jgi:undecaprenyl-diphosphatase
MKHLRQKRFVTAWAFLAAFALWTAAVCRIDVRPIGPLGSSVGFAALNRLVHNSIGVHMGLYTVTDLLGLIPVLFALGFALLGLVQWIRRKRIRKVDRSILLLGIFYVAVAAAYVLFEVFAINFRPVLIEGVLEVSYPSSTTMLALCVMPTGAMELSRRIKSRPFRHAVVAVITVFAAFMVIGRLLSGVHWFTDIVGGILLSAGLVLLYRAAAEIFVPSLPSKDRN